MPPQSFRDRADAVDDVETLERIALQLRSLRFSLQTPLAQRRGLAITESIDRAVQTALDTARRLREELSR